MPLLLGFVALAVDVGLMFRAEREMQTAADSGAIAGAEELNYGDVS
jgi:Flp pilus assembly protein TadG